MRTFRRILCALVGAAALTCAAARNLVPNPDFDDGLDGWTQTGMSGVMTLDTTFGAPTPPSLELASDTSNPAAGAGAVSECIPADDATHYDFFFNAFGGGMFGAVSAFSDTDCSTLLGSVGPSGQRSAGGTYGVFNVLLPSGTQSAQVGLASVGPPLGEGATRFDHVLFGPTGSVLDGINADQSGLSGSWYDPTESGQGLQFVISPGDTNPGSIFGAWYTYDTQAGGVETQRWYSIQGDVLSGINGSAFTIYENVGGMFDAPPATSAVAVGTGSLVFASCTLGEFSYDLDDGRSGAIPINSLLPSPTCVDANSSPTEVQADAGTGAWYDPDTGGQGFIINFGQGPAATTGTYVFAGWYSYAPDGIADGDAAGQRWFSLQGSQTLPDQPYPLTIYASTGGTFDSGATPVVTEAVGTATLTVESCTSATLDYAFDEGELAGKSGSIALSRLGSAPAGCQTPL